MMELDIPGWTLVVGLVMVALYLVWMYEEGLLRRRGLQTMPSSFPVFGPMFKVVLRLEHFIDFIDRLYRAFPEQRYMGYVAFLKPFVYIKDLELIKKIAIKDFDSFQDHNIFVTEEVDPLLGNNLFSLRGQKWRDMRTTLSPAFTGSKMRNMLEFVSECGDQMTNFYLKEMEKPINKELGYISIDMKDAFTRFTNDAIASSAFGLKIDSFKDRDNTFYRMAKVISDTSGVQALKFIGFSTFPGIMKLLRLRFINESTSGYFRRLVMGTMEARQSHNIHRPDMIHLLMQARAGSLHHEDQQADDSGFATALEASHEKPASKRNWSDDDLTAQAVLFLGAGFDTSSILLGFMAHELAVNRSIQEKLQQEVDALHSSCSGRPTYSDLNAMKYMDMVVSETLRFWPPAFDADRRCNKEYELPAPTEFGGKPYKIKVGEIVRFPIYSIHHDEKYFENPDVFDPERFSDENKGNIKPFSYLPFGIGPRNCIGSRFALMEAKTVMFHLLAKFDLIVIDKTQVPIRLSKSAMNAQAEKGFWMGLRPRKNAISY